MDSHLFGQKNFTEKHLQTDLKSVWDRISEESDPNSKISKRSLGRKFRTSKNLIQKRIRFMFHFYTETQHLSNKFFHYLRKSFYKKF